MSLRALAKKVGVSHALLYLIETGAREPDNFLLKKLFDTLNIDEDVLLKEPPIYSIKPYYRIEKRAKKEDLESLKQEVVDL